MTHDMSRLKRVTDESVITHHAKIVPTIVLITVHFSNSAKFHGNDKIPWQRANSEARLKIPRAAENCGPYLPNFLSCGLWCNSLQEVGAVCGVWTRLYRVSLHFTHVSVLQKILLCTHTLFHDLCSLFTKE